MADDTTNGNGDDEEFVWSLEPVQRLSRDLRLAGRTLVDTEVRYLVDAYYIIQEDRKRAKMQRDSLKKAGEPNAIIDYLFNQSRILETQIKLALDVYTNSHMMGSWMRDVFGIGPVISAGMLAHIDIDQAPVVGHIWQYAGIAGPPQQLKDRRASYRVKYKEPINPDTPPPFVLKSGQEVTPYYPDGEDTYIYQILVGEADAPEWEATADIQDVEMTYRISGQKPWEKGQKRPFNAKLKTLCWKAGQSFMKFSGDSRCYYGKIYRERKEYEIERNEAGYNAEYAAVKVKQVGRSTEAYKHFLQGRCPPGQIDGRARRYSVKLFLAHMHGVWYERHFGRPAPKPYPIAILGHAHYIPPPHS
jgi:hypothetical protein